MRRAARPFSCHPIWVGAITLALVATSACARDRQLKSQPSTTRLVLDSPKVRQLISAAKQRNYDWNPEIVPPEQIAFVDAMEAQPSIEVPPESYARLLEQPQAVRSKHPLLNPKYIKVQVTTGSASGQIGWGCLGDGFGYTTSWPCSVILASASL